MLSYRIIVIAIGLLATACVPIWQQKPQNFSNEDVFWQQRHPQLVQMETWSIRARTAIVQGKEGWNAGLVWQQYNDLYQIKIQGPFAQGGVSLIGNEEKVVLTMADGKQISSNNPDALLVEALDVQLPVNALRDWMRGIPYTKKTFESIEYDDEGKITHLTQQGWNIEFKRYVPFKQFLMPSKIFIKHDDQHLRLVISRWNLTTSEQASSWDLTK